MSWAPFNVRTDNVVCWTCEHFQWYPSQQEQVCQGECRKEAPQQQRFIIVENSDDDGEWAQSNYFAHLPYANIQWCNGYQRSQDLVNIPTRPPTLQDCPNGEMPNWIRPESLRQLPDPFTPPSLISKKPIEQSCWYCDHFQRAWEEIPEGPAPGGACYGNCQIQPPPTYTFQIDSKLTDGGSGDVIDWTPYAQIRIAPYEWCSRWERTKRDIPAPQMNSQGQPCVVDNGGG